MPACNRKKAENLITALLDFTGAARAQITDEFRKDQEQHIASQLDKLSPGDPFTFVISAMPFKGPNLDYVLGTMPDAGEEAALHTLVSLGAKASEILDRNTEIIIASDGFAYAPVFRIQNSDVLRYRQGVKDMLEGIPQTGTTIKVFGLDDLLKIEGTEPGSDGYYDALRESFMNEFSISAEEFDEEVENDKDLDGLICTELGKRKKFYGTQIPKKENEGNRPSRRRCSDAARTMYRIQRAWDSLVAYRVSPANGFFWLSIHAKANEKWPVQLVPTIESGHHCAPWWRAPLKTPDDSILLVSSSEAKEKGHKLEMKGDQSWCYTVSPHLVCT